MGESLERVPSMGHIGEGGFIGRNTVYDGIIHKQLELSTKIDGLSTSRAELGVGKRPYMGGMDH